MKLVLPVLAIPGLIALSSCRRAPEPDVSATPSPAPAATPAGELPYRPPSGPPSLAPQATPGSQAPGLNDQQKVEQLFREAN